MWTIDEEKKGKKVCDLRSQKRRRSDKKRRYDDLNSTIEGEGRKKASQSCKRTSQNEPRRLMIASIINRFRFHKSSVEEILSHHCLSSLLGLGWTERKMALSLLGTSLLFFFSRIIRLSGFIISERDFVD